MLQNWLSRKDRCELQVKYIWPHVLFHHHSPGGPELFRSHLTNPVTPLLAMGDTRSSAWLLQSMGFSLTLNGPLVKGLASLDTSLAWVKTSAPALAGRAFHSRPQKSEGRREWGRLKCLGNRTLDHRPKPTQWVMYTWKLVYSFTSHSNLTKSSELMERQALGQSSGCSRHFPYS